MSVDLTGIGGVADLIKSSIDKIWPDKTKAAELKAQVDQAQMAGQLKELELAYQNAGQQLEVNKVEAASQSLFVAGWRPAIGWICGLSLFYQAIFRDLWAVIGTSITHAPMVLPPLDTQLTYSVMMGMLGLGVMRTVEKIKGVAAGAH